MQELHLLPKAVRPASAPSAAGVHLSSCFTPTSASVAFPAASSQPVAIPAALAATAAPCSAVTAPWTAVTAAALAALTTVGETIAAARNTRSERGREEGREGSANELKDSAAERGAVTDAKANFDREASTYFARRRHTRSGGCRCCRRISCSPGDPPLLLLLLCAVAPFGCLGSRTEGNPEADPRRPQGAEAEAAGG